MIINLTILNVFCFYKYCIFNLIYLLVLLVLVKLENNLRDECFMFHILLLYEWLV